MSALSLFLVCFVESRLVSLTRTRTLRDTRIRFVYEPRKYPPVGSPAVVAGTV